MLCSIFRTISAAKFSNKATAHAHKRAVAKITEQFTERVGYTS